MRRPMMMTFLNCANVEKLRERKKKKEYNIQWIQFKGPHSLSVSPSGPRPGSLGKCQAVDWQRMKDRSGGGGVGRRAGGSLRQGRKNDVSEVFQTPYLSSISTHFQQVQSQFMKQSTSVYRSPLTSPYFMLGLSTHTHSAWEQVCVYIRSIKKNRSSWECPLMRNTVIRHSEKLDSLKLQ